MRLPCKLFVLAMALLLVQLTAAESGDLEAADIIERVARVLRVSPETAETWHAGVANLDAWPARLEQALLETLGPDDLRDAEAGLTTLETLLHDEASDVRVTEGARETLSVIFQLIERQVNLADERDRSVRQLAEEREAHRQTIEKLNALRDIDHQLDERENDGGP